MTEGISRYTFRLFSKPLGQRRQAPSKQDYRAKLWNTPVCESQDENGPDARVCPYADQIRSAISDTPNGVAFQSLAVASLQTLRSVLHLERQAADAAISLAQGQKLEDMIHTSEATVNAIASALDSQGSRMLNLSLDADDESDGGNSWWFALTETIEAIEDGTKRVLSLASGQPKGGAARRLSAVVVRLLRSQHRQLLAEADAWIS